MKTIQQLTHFVYQICSAFSAVAVVISLSSLAQAQTAFPDRYRDVIDFRRAGISDAVVEVACEHGDQKLVDAVYKENRIKPQFILNDDGTKSCLLPGGCSDKGETGQLPQRCESKRTDVKWFGDRDVRNDASAYLSPSERAKYSAIGRIVCSGQKAKRDPKTNEPMINPENGLPIIEVGELKATAFHVGNYSTLITNAHAFTEDKYDPVTKKVIEVRIPDARCAAAFYDASGNMLERIPLAFVESRWDEPGLFRDVSQDIAIVKLARESRTPTDGFKLNANVGMPINKMPVTVVGWHGDVENKDVIRKTQGFVYSAPSDLGHLENARKNGFGFSNLRNMVVGDYPSNHGTSGSPILAPDGSVIGIHQGHADKKSNSGVSDRQFNQSTNYNLGILFDEQVIADIKRVMNTSVL